MEALHKRGWMSGREGKWKKSEPKNWRIRTHNISISIHSLMPDRSSVLYNKLNVFEFSALQTITDIILYIWSSFLPRNHWARNSWVVTKQVFIFLFFWKSSYNVHTKWPSFLGLKMYFLSIIQHKIHVLIKTLQTQNVSN